MSNPESILDSVKKTLGIDSADTSFDIDIVMFINSSFGTLQQLGVGAPTGFYIADNTTLWSDYIWRSDFLGMVKQLVIMLVKMVFDPAERFALAAHEKVIEELKYRIVLAAETPLMSGWWDLTGLSDFPAEALAGDFGFDPATGNIYVNGTQSIAASWWDLTGLSDFPVGAVIGEFGFDSVSGNVWRKTS